jgi:hypothetical protein
MSELGPCSQMKVGEEGLSGMLHPGLVTHRFLHLHNEVGA